MVIDRNVEPGLGEAPLVGSRPGLPVGVDVSQGVAITPPGAAPGTKSRLIARVLPVLLILSVGLPALGLVAVILDGQRAIQHQAEAEIIHTADAAAALAARILDGHRLIGQRVDDLLRGRSDADIAADEAGLHAEVGEMLRHLTRPLTVLVMNRSGRLLLTKT